mgnify:CR=1 FL=1
MLSKNVLFSLGIALSFCSGCAPANSSTATTLPKGVKLTPQEEALAKINAQIKQLKEEQEVLNAQVYEANDEAMRQEFNHSWMTYEGDVSTQEDVEARLKEIDALLPELEQQKQALQSTMP